MTTPRPIRGDLVAAAVLLVVLALVSVLVGVGRLSGADGVELVLVSRLPRTAAALLTGAGLAIAGLIMQTLARNRFVDPMISGSGESAGLGILAMTILAPGASIALKTLAASGAAFVGTALFLVLARRLPPTEPYLVPLFAIVYGGVVGALTTAVAWEADLLQYLSIWTNGEFSAVMQGRYELLWVISALVAVAWWVADRLTILALGRDTAVGLGLNYTVMQQAGLAIVATIAGVSVATVGLIPFVGLVVPALAVRRYGEDVRAVLPIIAAGGAGLVLSCDIVARLLRFPYEVPVGTVLGVVGTAAFIAVLLARPRHA
ncbi:ABC transporter permease [Acuticoccus sp. I52.16.1]|uniref:ABC transporter permease n=1 Tax=Acuticoccus sp. I52.16.1 TaxID=2928472 RepID=UPI001FD4E2F9|nr:iron chelate uptake ABC transporter family permease subunit [Acuticoccus sp. I52.16.1]UOM35636.1 iron chelate uptake ABC transporter family permease subunit [Acuticoccus sp. I52.16.1]